MIRRGPRELYARKGGRADVAELKAARRDPAEVAQLVAEFQAKQELKKRGVLRPYVRVGGR
jgi:hypothetical protein